MALITCSECGKQISDKAKSCIYCGCPMKNIMQGQEKEGGISPDEYDSPLEYVGLLLKRKVAGNSDKKVEATDANATDTVIEDASTIKGAVEGQEQGTVSRSPDSNKKSLAIVFGIIAVFFAIMVYISYTSSPGAAARKYFYELTDNDPTWKIRWHTETWFQGNEQATVTVYCYDPRKPGIADIRKTIRLKKANGKWVLTW